VEPISDGSVERLPASPELVESQQREPLAPVSYVDTSCNRPAKRARGDKLRLADMLGNADEPIVLCEVEYPHQITHPNQAWLAMCGYTLEEVEGLTNRILTGPETDQAAIDDLLECVRREETSVQTLVNYKRGGVRFLNQVKTMPVYDEQDDLAAFMSLLSEVGEKHNIAGPLSINPGHGHLWAALEKRFMTTAGSGTDAAAREEATALLLRNHEGVLADMTSPIPSPSQPDLKRICPSMRPYADQALRDACRRLLGCPVGSTGRGVHNEALEVSHPMRAAQQTVWVDVATYLDKRIQTKPHPTGRAPDMSEAAAGAMRAALWDMARAALQ